jgi:3-methyladenine DNA glycosylase AlkD
MVHPLVEALQASMRAAADPAKAAPMQAYMKTDQPFYGLQRTERRRIFRETARRFPLADRAACETVVRALWAGTHREDQYMALEAAEHYRAFHDAAAWPLYEHLVRTAAWWDTLDWIASKLVSPLVRRHRAFEADLVRWSHDPGRWVRRAALLAHLHHRDQTNTRLLAETILHLAPDPDFFIRKAIGWVLRDYAYTDPDWVRAFVEAHRDVLSGLSRREALKHAAPP